MRLDPASLLVTARKLAKSGKGERRPRQADLRRAMSSAYYALFHQVCADYASHLVGRTSDSLQSDAWRQAYRSIDHRSTRTNADRVAREATLPLAVTQFAAKFSDMQQKRHAADYDPFFAISREEVLNEIDQVELALTEYRKAKPRDRRTFLAILISRSGRA